MVHHHNPNITNHQHADEDEGEDGSLPQSDGEFSPGPNDALCFEGSGEFADLVHEEEAVEVDAASEGVLGGTAADGPVAWLVDVLWFCGSSVATKTEVGEAIATCSTEHSSMVLLLL